MGVAVELNHSPEMERNFHYTWNLPLMLFRTCRYTVIGITEVFYVMNNRYYNEIIKITTRN